jgi:hypothetical protein
MTLLAKIASENCGAQKSLAGWDRFRNCAPTAQHLLSLPRT